MIVNLIYFFFFIIIVFIEIIIFIINSNNIIIIIISINIGIKVINIISTKLLLAAQVFYL